MYSFGQMVEMVLDEGHNTDDTGRMQDRVRRWLNEELIQLTTDFDFPGLVARSLVLLNQAQSTLDEFYVWEAVPWDVCKIIRADIFDGPFAVTTRRFNEMEILSRNDFRKRFIRDARRSTTAADHPNRNRPRFIALERINSVDARTLVAGGGFDWTVRSTVTENVSTTAVLYGFTDFDQRRLPVKGVTAAQITSTPQSLGVTGIFPMTFSKNEQSIGEIILSDSTIDRARIPPWELTAQAPAFLLYPFPDLAGTGSYTIYFDYKRRPPLMSLDADVPSGLPYEAWPIIIEGALSRILRFMENSDWQNAERRKAQMKAELATKLKEEQIETAGFEWEQPSFMDNIDLSGHI